jgi:hypothetical protein
MRSEEDRPDPPGRVGLYLPLFRIGYCKGLLRKGVGELNPTMQILQIQFEISGEWISDPSPKTVVTTVTINPVKEKATKQDSLIKKTTSTISKTCHKKTELRQP